MMARAYNPVFRRQGDGGGGVEVILCRILRLLSSKIRENKEKSLKAKT